MTDTTVTSPARRRRFRDLIFGPTEYTPQQIRQLELIRERHERQKKEEEERLARPAHFELGQLLASVGLPGKVEDVAGRLCSYRCKDSGLTPRVGRIMEISAPYGQLVFMVEGGLSGKAFSTLTCKINGSEKQWSCVWYNDGRQEMKVHNLTIL